MDFSIPNLDDVFTEINSNFGKKSTINIGESNDLTVMPVDFKFIQIATGISGIPRGKIIEFYGGVSSCKSVLMYIMLANLIDKGMSVILFDNDISLNPNHAISLGIQPSKLLVGGFSDGQEVFDSVIDLVVSNSVDVIVIDSVASILPPSYSKYKYQNKFLKSQFKKLQRAMINSRTSVICTNQIRYTKGDCRGVPACGNPLDSIANQIFHIKKLLYYNDDNDSAYGARLELSVVKNTVSKTSGSVEFDILFTSMFPFENEIIDLCLAFNILQKNGPWYYYNGVIICNGRDKLIDYLKNNTEFYVMLKSIVDGIVNDKNYNS